MDDVIGFVLAGGRSTRMGADKAQLDWHGRSLLEHALELTRSVAPVVRIVGPRDKFNPYGEVIEDVYADRGPLAGIHAALASSATELNLILAVDIPFVSARFLEYLVAQARESQAMVTVPKAGGGWQPLCAVYRREFAAVAEKALLAGKNKVDALFADVPLRVVDLEELRRLAFEPAMFDNLNTREELDRARARQGRNS